MVKVMGPQPLMRESDLNRNIDELRKETFMKFYLRMHPLYFICVQKASGSTIGSTYNNY